MHAIKTFSICTGYDVIKVSHYVIAMFNVQCSMFNVSPQTIDNIDYVTVVYTIYAQTEDKCTQAHRKKLQWNNEHIF